MSKSHKICQIFLIAASVEVLARLRLMETSVVGQSRSGGCGVPLLLTPLSHAFTRTRKSSLGQVGLIEGSALIRLTKCYPQTYGNAPSNALLDVYKY